MARLSLEDEISAILLAGGMGTRIRQLFPDIPKPMIPLAGVPIVEWVVRLWALQGVRHFVLSTGYLGDVIEQHFAGRAELRGLKIDCVRESSPLGTGGALVFAVQNARVREHLLVGNADSLASVGIGSCLGQFVSRRADVLIGTAFRDDTSQFGSVEIGQDNRIVSFGEKLPGPGFVNAGMYLTSRDCVSRFTSERPLSIERDIFPRLLADKALFLSHPIQGEFLDIGTPAGYAAAEQFLCSLPEYEAALHFRHA